MGASKRMGENLPEIKRDNRVAMIKMEADDYENILTQKWLDGHHHVYGDLLVYLHEKAGASFISGKDAEAKLLRDEIPKLLKPFFDAAEKRAEEHDKTYNCKSPRVTEFMEDQP